MLKLIIFLTFALLSNVAFTQVKNYSGKIYDLFNIKLDGVVISNMTTNESVESDCYGRFTIRAAIGDTITFTKGNYLVHRKKIVNNKKIKVLLNYDTVLIKSKLEEYENDKYIENPNYISCRCQPLFLIDGEPFIGSGHIDMEKSVIKSTKVLKDSKAISMLGEYANSGAIFINTICGYEYQKD